MEHHGVHFNDIRRCCISISWFGQQPFGSSSAQGMKWVTPIYQRVRSPAVRITSDHKPSQQDVRPARCGKTSREYGNDIREREREREKVLGMMIQDRTSFTSHAFRSFP